MRVVNFVLNNIFFVTKKLMQIVGHPNYLIYDDGRVYNNKHKRFLACPTNKSTGYKQLCLDKIQLYVHHLVAKHYLDDYTNELVIDHINRNKEDNRVQNLRMVTSKENALNRTSNKGVVYNYVDLPINAQPFDHYVARRGVIYEFNNYWFYNHVMYQYTGVGYRILH